MEADLSGTHIGEYEVVAPIGRGGMGMVYEGRQPMIGKRVAIKVLLKAFSNQPEVVERFLSEARAVNAIRHRGIVDIFSFGQLEDGTRFCVMEFLEGLPFDELIRTRAPFTPGDALRFIDEVLDALDAAHRTGVIHRDIKPSNLFLCDTGHGRPYVKLLDFGIAKLSSFKGGASVGEASAVVGTPDYMAPEQARAKTISGATDLYAVGCVLFELLARERVFEGLSPVDMMFAHVQKAPRAPSVVQPGIPREVDAFVLKLLAKNPEDRHKSAVAAREEVHLLFRMLNEAPTLPPPSAYTVRAPLSERVATGSNPPATPRPGWNSDDKGMGQTWVSSGTPLPAAADAKTQIGEPILQDSSPAIPKLTPGAQSRVTEQAPKKSSALMFGGVAGAVALAGFGAWALLSREPPPPPPILVEPIQKPIAPTVVEEPVAVVDAGVPEEAVVDAGLPEPVIDAGIKPHVVKKPSGPTKEQLVGKLDKLQARLEKLEGKRKEPDKLLRTLMKGAREAVNNSRSPLDVRSAAEQVDGVRIQLEASEAQQK